MAKCCVAAIAVSVLRGSTTMISGLCWFRMHALPHDRVGDAEIRAEEDEHVALLEIRVGVGRRVEAKGLLCRRRDDVAMHWRVLPSQWIKPMPNFPERPRNAISSVTDLARAEPGDGFRPVLSLDLFEALAEEHHRALPIDRFQLAAGSFRRSGVVARSGRCERRERLPAFRTGHPEVHRVMRVRAEVDRLPIPQMDIQPAAGGAEAADHRGGVVRLEPRRHLARDRTGPASARDLR